MSLIRKTSGHSEEAEWARQALKGLRKSRIGGAAGTELELEALRLERNDPDKL